MRRNIFVVGLLVYVAILTGCIIPSFLKPTYDNLTEKRVFRADPEFGNDIANPNDIEETEAERVYKSINAVHLDLIADLSRNAGSAAGFVVKYNNKPYIITAGHVNTDVVKFKALYASFSQGQKKPEEVEIVLADHFLDFSLLGFKDPAFVYNGPYAKIGSCRNLRIGQKVYAIGSPLRFKFYLSEGIVGKLEQGMDHDGIFQPEIIMHGAVINPGNSGGPLLNSKGEVIGINVMGINGGVSLFRPSATTTMPVAIPIDSVVSVLRRLHESGKIKHSYLGLKLWDTHDLNPMDYEQREVPVPDHDGLIVFMMVPGSPAEKAGLQRGDLILEVDGKKYEKTSDIAKHALFEIEPGTEMEFKVLRGYNKPEQAVETGDNGQPIYKLSYKKLAAPETLTIKVKPEVK